MFRGYDFDRSGGRLCLDFANTLSRTTGEHLYDYVDLVEFASGDERLAALGQSRSEEAETFHRRALALRRAIFEIFHALASCESAPTGAVELLNDELARALPRARVQREGAGYAWGWDDDPNALDRPLWPIARDAAELLVDKDLLQRLRFCAAADCDWLFLDLSKNRSRQWCDMKVCGNRAKARRFYERHKETPKS